MVVLSWFWQLQVIAQRVFVDGTEADWSQSRSTQTALFDARLCQCVRLQCFYDFR